MSSAICFNLDHSKILLSVNGLTRKFFVDDKLKVAERTNFFLDKTENIVKKGENSGYLHFLLFLSTMFLKVSSARVILRQDASEYW